MMSPTVSLGFCNKKLCLLTLGAATRRGFSSKAPPRFNQNFSHSSQMWLRRQQKDPYVQQAKILRYRSRSAFKLLEMDEKLQLLRHGMTVVEAGAAPGSWTQVIVEGVNSLQQNGKAAVGTVVAFDKQDMLPVDGATVLTMADILDAKTEERIREALGSQKAHAVLSDMAPNATGDKRTDHVRIMKLCYTLFQMSVLHLMNRGGTFVCKIWDGHARQKFTEDLSRFFDNVKQMKPDSSRDDSSELYVVARGLKKL